MRMDKWQALVSKMACEHLDLAGGRVLMPSARLLQGIRQASLSLSVQRGVEQPASRSHAGFQSLRAFRRPDPVG